MQIDPATLRGDWSYPTRVRFGPGRIAELAQACRELGMTRPLLVTDPGLAALAMVKDALARNQDAGLPTALFSDVKGNPVAANVDAGVAAYRAAGCDGVIAFGGGSGLDAAKAVALMVGQTRPIWDFEDREDWHTRANAEGIAPVVAVPTTAGTGSEVGRAAVITDHDTKKIIFHPRMLPGIVVSDPVLTVGLPPHITAATGMDALAHNLEAYCAPGFHPMADGIALEGVRLIREWLPAAVRDGADLAARAHMLAAASMGAAAFQKGLGAIHALSHPIGAVHDTHHGLTNAVVMPYVLAFNRPAIEQRMTRLAAYLGLPDPSFDAVQGWILDLREEIGIVHTLAGLGIGEEHVDALVPMAAADPTCGGNPVPIGEPELRRMFLMAINGDLGETK
ncbi:MAG: iron-containing alcohol dehydrogenase [Proteobacteria bacterium]|nr:iron-containing alcohol dehydrogenase [Pseudomonadota bacterium]